MQYIVFLIIGILLAAVESNVRVGFWNVGINFMAVGVFGIGIYAASKNNLGAGILIFGSLALDLLSPLRMGWYLLFASTVLLSYEVVAKKFIDYDQPLINGIVFFLSLFVLHLAEFAFNPILPLFFASLLLNTFFTLGIYYLSHRYLNAANSKVKLSRDVNL